MALPVDVTYRTVVGTFLDFSGAPMSGKITVTAGTSERDTSTTPATSVTPNPVTWTLDVSGNIPTGKTLPVTDGALIPNGFTYTAQFALTSFNGASRTDSFTFTVPTSGSNLDLVAAAPAVPVTATTAIVTSVNGEVGDVIVSGAGGAAAVNTATVGTAYTIPSPLLYEENVLTLNQASATITLPTVGPGLSFLVEFVTAVNSPAITWSPVPRYDSGTPYVPSTASGSVDIVSLVSFATHWNLLVVGKGMA